MDSNDPRNPKGQYIDYLLQTALLEAKVTVPQKLWDCHLQEYPDAQPDADGTNKLHFQAALDALSIYEESKTPDRNETGAPREDSHEERTPRTNKASQAMYDVIEKVWDGQLTNRHRTNLAETLFNDNTAPNIALNEADARAVADQVVACAEAARAKLKQSVIARSPGGALH